MARPQQSGYAPKPSKDRRTGPEKMQMSHERLRKDLKRIQVEAAKAADNEKPKHGRR
jgi:hypothetical protein